MSWNQSSIKKDYKKLHGWERKGSGRKVVESNEPESVFNKEEFQKLRYCARVSRWEGFECNEDESVFIKALHKATLLGEGGYGYVRRM